MAVLNKGAGDNGHHGVGGVDKCLTVALRAAHQIAVGAGVLHGFTHTVDQIVPLRNTVAHLDLDLSHRLLAGDNAEFHLLRGLDGQAADSATGSSGGAVLQRIGDLAEVVASSQHRGAANGIGLHGRVGDQFRPLIAPLRVLVPLVGQAGHAQLLHADVEDPTAQRIPGQHHILSVLHIACDYRGVAEFTAAVIGDDDLGNGRVDGGGRLALLRVGDRHIVVGDLLLARSHVIGCLGGPTDSPAIVCVADIPLIAQGTRALCRNGEGKGVAGLDRDSLSQVGGDRRLCRGLTVPNSRVAFLSSRCRFRKRLLGSSDTLCHRLCGNGCLRREFLGKCADGKHRDYHHQRHQE